MIDRGYPDEKATNAVGGTLSVSTAGGKGKLDRNDRGGISRSPVKCR